MYVERVSPYLWRVPQDKARGMRVPGLVVADEALMEAIRSDASLEQIANGATLPGIVKASLAMPDIHQGYGLPVGGVVATDAERGVVSPGAIGFDINCGVRLLRTGLDAEEIAPRVRDLVDALYATIPTGVGAASTVSLTPRELTAVMEDGAAWAASRGYGEREDLAHIESEGRLAGARSDAVSPHARERGLRQLGSLGSGNHFLELQVVEEIYDAQAAARFGVRAGQLTVMIHTGSRGIGHQVCTDYLKTTGAALKRYGISVPDRQLACAPIDSPEAADYLGAMRAAANFAFANRQVLAHVARDVLERVLGRSPRDLAMRVVYDVAHNIAKEEEHEVDGRRRRLIVHRKGATRAFPGQPVIVPGDMGRYSYLLVGTEAAMRETFGSTCHGAGRRMSRTAAKNAARGRRIDQELEARGVVARATGRDALAEEMPEAYKDVREVVDVVHGFGISTRVARLKPIGVIKG
jgi:tRNA-splicing ligase RtcB